MLALTAVAAIAASPASASGQPVPPFEDETWLINIAHTDEYWLNVRYNVFRPGWTHADQGYSGAHVTGHSGCGEASPPLLVNTAYAAEGEHEIIVYWGGYCTHDDDKGDETKYDDFPDGTPIAVSATLELYLPGETAPSEAFSAAGTVIVSGEAAPPVSLGSIVVDRSNPQTGAAESTTSSSTTASGQDGAAEDPEGAATGTGSDVNSDQATATSTDDKFMARLIAGLIIVCGLVLGVAAVILLFKEIFDRPTPLEKAARARRARKSAAAPAVAVSEWYPESATHEIEPGSEVDVTNPVDVAQLQARGIKAKPGMTVPLPTGDFVPTGELIGSKHVEGRAGDRVVAYPPGTPVQLITTTGDQALVRVNAKTEIWVPRSSIGGATATDQIDPPSAPAPGG